MYCKKCGKFIGSESDLCDECATNVGEVFSEFSKEKQENEQAVVTYSQEDYTANKPTVKLGSAIAAFILSTVGFAVIYFGFLFGLELTAATLNLEVLGVSIVCGLIGCVPALLGLIFGIASVINFKATSTVRSGKRIPLLILGILAILDAVLSFFIVIILFFIILLILSAV